MKRTHRQAASPSPGAHSSGGDEDKPFRMENRGLNTLNTETSIYGSEQGANKKVNMKNFEK